MPRFPQIQGCCLHRIAFAKGRASESCDFDGPNVRFDEGIAFQILLSDMSYTIEGADDMDLSFGLWQRVVIYMALSNCERLPYCF